MKKCIKKKTKNIKDKSQILKVKNKYSKEMMKKYKLSGIGIGEKRIKGKFTGELCVVFMVEKKLLKSKIPKDKLLPSSLDRIKTDVIEIGKIKAIAVYDTKIRPAVPGYSIGHPNITAGTLGCVVYKGATRYILSNNHVIADSNDATIGDKIYQPGVVDGGVEADTIAYLDSFITLEDDVNVDCALAEITDNDLVDDIGVWGGSINNYTDPELNDVIYKTGRTTGTNYNILTYEHTDVNVNYGGSLGIITIVDCFITTNNWQVLGGDSGSIGRLNNNIAVGLAFAAGGQSVGSEPYFSVFNYMSNVVSALSLDLSYITHPVDLRYTLHSQGANSPETIINTPWRLNGGGGFDKIDWQNPTNAKTEDASFATIGPVNNTTTASEYLRCTDFGFTVPANAIINSIVVEIKYKSEGSASAFCTIHPVVGVLGSDKQSSYGVFIFFPVPSVLQYWSWNLSNNIWNVDDVNNQDFGVEIRDATGTNNPVDVIEYIDHVRMTVSYVTRIIPSRKTIIDSGKKVIIDPTKKTIIG